MVATGPRKLVAMLCMIGIMTLGGAGVVAVGQIPQPVAPPKATTPKGDLTPKPANPERKPVEKLEDLPEIELLPTDSAEMTIAKKVLLLQLKRNALIETRITTGQLSGAANYIQVCDTLSEITEAAQEAFPAAKDQLPWFEFRHAQLIRWEKFNSARVNEGLEEPQLGPQLRAAMFKAELALLKVQKKAKK